MADTQQLFSKGIVEFRWKIVVCSADTDRDGQITVAEFFAMTKKVEDGQFDKTAYRTCLPAGCDLDGGVAIIQKVLTGELPIADDGSFMTECAGCSSFSVNMLMMFSLATLVLMICP